MRKCAQYPERHHALAVTLAGADGLDQTAVWQRMFARRLRIGGLAGQLQHQQGPGDRDDLSCIHDTRSNDAGAGDTIERGVFHCALALPVADSLPPTRQNDLKRLAILEQNRAGNHAAPAPEYGKGERRAPVFTQPNTVDPGRGRAAEARLRQRFGALGGHQRNEDTGGKSACARLCPDAFRQT
jgi:hypothetical protein